MAVVFPHSENITPKFSRTKPTRKTERSNKLKLNNKGGQGKKGGGLGVGWNTLLYFFMFKILFFSVAAVSAVVNAYSLYDGNFDSPELGWCVAAALFVAIVVEAIRDKVST